KTRGTLRRIAAHHKEAPISKQIGACLGEADDGSALVHPPTCACCKSHPAILMVQSAQDRAADDIPGPLNAARDRGILVQRQMSARGVVVIFVRQQNVAQMAFAEDYDMINAFPSD